MKKETTKLVSIILAALMTAGTLVSCSESAVQEDGEKAADASTEVNSEEIEVAEDNEITMEQDKVPELDFGGIDVNICGQGSPKEDGSSGLWSDGYTGEIVNDGVYDARLYLEDRINVKYVEPLVTDYTTISTTIKNSVQAGDGTYLIVENQLAQTSSDVLNGFSMNLNDIPYLDFDRSWYPQEIKESATYNGKLLLTVSDMCLNYVEQTWTMAFEKDKATNYHVENLYDCVREGTWTWDKFKSVSEGIYEDVNGNGARDEDDFYGATLAKSGFDGCMAAAFVYGAGLRFFEIDENGEINPLLGSERAVSFCEKVNSLMKCEGFMTFSNAQNISHWVQFLTNGNVMFAPSQFWHYYSHCRDYDGTFGVLPLPKYDEQQEGYYTLCDAGCNCLTIPVTCTDTSLAGAVIEIQSMYYHNYVVPSYMDVALKSKTARDPESAEMMQLTLNGRVMDFGYLYCGWSGWTWKLNDMFKDPGTYISTYEKNLKVMNKTYEKIMKAFADE